MGRTAGRCPPHRGPSRPHLRQLRPQPHQALRPTALSVEQGIEHRAISKDRTAVALHRLGAVSIGPAPYLARGRATQSRLHKSYHRTWPLWPAPSSASGSSRPRRPARPPKRKSSPCRRRPRAHRVRQGVHAVVSEPRPPPAAWSGPSGPASGGQPGRFRRRGGGTGAAGRSARATGQDEVGSLGASKPSRVRPSRGIAEIEKPFMLIEVINAAGPTRISPPRRARCRAGRRRLLPSQDPRRRRGC